MGVARGGRTPKLGGLLKEYREPPDAKKRSLEQIARRLADYGFSTDKSTLSQYERGRPPDIGILWGLALVYRVDFGALCTLMAEELHGAKLSAGAPGHGLSDEAVAIAQAFDTGSEALKAAIRSSVVLAGGMSARDSTRNEQRADEGPEAGVNRGRNRKSPGRRAG